MSDKGEGSTAAEPEGGAAGLDFDRAEVEGTSGGATCGACQQPIHDEYWQLLDKTLCGSCSRAVDRSAASAKAAGTFVHALFRAGAVAFACGVGYALFAHLTHYNLALITIGIGWMVGRSVQKATRGFGTVKHQVLAVALTYAASTMGYFPAVVGTIVDSAKKSQTTAAATVAPSVAPAPETPPSGADKTGESGAPPAKKASVGLALVVVTALVTALTLAAPLLEITSGFSGLLGVLIIFFGLRTAWRVSKGVAATMTGPHRLAPADGT